MNGLDLFSGIGGITLALEPWVRPIAYCELDPYCQGVLLSRMRNGQLPKAPIWDDVQTLQASEFPVGAVDIIYGGFPCQDISVASPNPTGLAGKRSGLFREIVRLVDEIQPEFLFLENVPAITIRGLGEVTAEISKLRYDCRWGMLSAYDVGAPHLRQRWFLLAHSNRKRREANEKSDRKPVSRGEIQSGHDADRLHHALSHSDGKPLRDDKQWLPRGWDNLQAGGQTISRNDGGEKPLVDAQGVGRGEGDSNSRGSEERAGTSEEWSRSPNDSGWWSTEPNVGRVVNGLPFRVDRVRGLGNAVVPLQAREAFKRLMGL